MFPPRPPRKVRKTSGGRYPERCSRRSRSTKSTAPCVGYRGRSCIRPDSRSTFSRMSMIPPTAPPSREPVLLYRPRRAERSGASAGGAGGSARLERLDQPPDHGVEGGGDPGLRSVLDDLAVDVVDLGPPSRLDILAHGRLVVPCAPDVADAVGVEIRAEEDLVRPGHGDPLLDQGVDQGEEDRVADDLGHRLAGDRADRVHAGVQDRLPPDQAQDLPGVDGVEPAPGEDLADRDGALARPGVELLENVGAMVEGEPDVARSDRNAPEIHDRPQDMLRPQVVREDPFGVDAVLPADHVPPLPR